MLGLNNMSCSIPEGNQTSGMYPHFTLTCKHVDRVGCINIYCFCFTKGILRQYQYVISANTASFS